jgi:hypothetical protein
VVAGEIQGVNIQDPDQERQKFPRRALFLEISDGSAAVSLCFCRSHSAYSMAGADPCGEMTTLRVEYPWSKLIMSPEVSPATDDKQRIRNSARVHGVAVYTRLLVNLRDKQTQLLKKRQGIDHDLVELQRTFNTLLAACKEDSVSLPSDLLLPFSEEMPLSLSLIDAVRNLLKQSGNWMTAGEVRDGLMAMELDLAKLWNPVVVIRNTLKRLMERGEIAGSPEDKPVRYQWINPAGRATKVDPLSAARRAGAAKIHSLLAKRNPLPNNSVSGGRHEARSPYSFPATCNRLK